MSLFWPPGTPSSSLLSYSPLDSPTGGSLKINCDASRYSGHSRGWGGIILRDSSGRLIDGRRFQISTNSAFLVEASVIREACLFAKAFDINSTTIENDNAQLISLSVSELVPTWEVMAIISDIRLLAAELIGCCFPLQFCLLFYVMMRFSFFLLWIFVIFLLIFLD